MNGLPIGLQTDNFFKNMKISKQEYRILKQTLQRDRHQRRKERFEHISGWYGENKRHEYLEAVGNKDVTWFENNCRCFMNDIECPACQMIRLFKEQS